jgi:outer membrane protein insertion porin family
VNGLLSRMFRLPTFRVLALGATFVTLGAPDALAQRRTPQTEAPETAPQPQSGARIREIRVEGNKKAEADAIRSKIKSRVGEPVDPARVAQDIKDIYTLGLFRDVVVESLPSGSGVALVYRVVEKPSIWSITFEGNDKVTQKDIEAVVDIKPFSILDKGAIAKSVEKIKALYAEKGFFLAEVTYRLKEIKGNRVILVYRIDENRKVQVRKINFIGNKHASDTDLRAVMQTKQGDAFSFLSSRGTYREDVFAGDVELLSSWYLDHGFIKIQIDPPRVALSRDKRFITITINVSEGEPYRVSTVDLKGDLPGEGEKWPAPEGTTPEKKEKLLREKEKLAELLQIKPGKVFSRAAIGQDIVRLTERYSDDGYAFANIFPVTVVDEEKKTITIAFDVQKGTRVYIERINVRGNTITRDKVVRRELDLAEGDLFNGSKLKRSKENITRLGYFEDVTFSTPRGSREDRLVLNIDVKEKPTGIFSVGAGFSSAENFVFTAQVQKNNFLGYGYSVAAAANVSSLQQRFDLQFLDPFFLDTNWTAGVDLYNRQQVFRSYTRLDRGGDVSFGHYVDERREAHVAATYRLENTKVADVNQALRPIFGTPGLTSSVIGTLSWDRRDNRLFPTKGFLASASAEYAGGPLGGQLDFLRFTYNARAFYPVGWLEAFQPVARANVTFGQIFSTTGAPIPIFEKFTAGGINSVRGYALNSLGPSIRVMGTGDPAAPDQRFSIGGNELGIMNIELEFPIIKPAQIRGVVFDDAGNAFAANAPIRWEDLRKAYGFGVRWFSPIGPLRFEWGFPINRKPDEAPRQFEFTIGSFF